MSKTITQKDVEDFFKRLKSRKEEPEHQLPGRKKTIWDCERPVKFTQVQIKNITEASENVIKGFQDFINSEYDIPIKMQVMHVDQCNFIEFTHFVPNHSPACSFEWMNGAVFFEIDPFAFYEVILGKPGKQNDDPNVFERKIFMELISKPFEKIIHNVFSKLAGKTLPEISNQKFVCNSILDNSPIKSEEMGIIIDIEITIGEEASLISLFMTASCLESLKGTTFFQNDKESITEHLETPAPNTFAEIGRFHLDDGETLKETFIYKTNKPYRNELDIYKNQKFICYADALVVDKDLSGVRLIEAGEEAEENKQSDFLNTILLFGTCTTEDDYEFKDGRMFLLNEGIVGPHKIVKDGKVIGLGEVVVIDDNYGVKVKKVLDN